MDPKYVVDTVIPQMIDKAFKLWDEVKYTKKVKAFGLCHRFYDEYSISKTVEYKEMDVLDVEDVAKKIREKDERCILRGIVAVGDVVPPPRHVETFSKMIDNYIEVACVLTDLGRFKPKIFCLTNDRSVYSNRELESAMREYAKDTTNYELEKMIKNNIDFEEKKLGAVDVYITTAKSRYPGYFSYED